MDETKNRAIQLDYEVHKELLLYRINHDFKTMNDAVKALLAQQKMG